MTVEDAFAGVRKTYVDTAPIIYALATAHGFGPASQSALAYCLVKGIELISSPITLAECLAGESDHQRQSVFIKYFTDSSGITLSDMNSTIAIEAARLRRTTSLKLPGYVPVATALKTGCDVF